MLFSILLERIAIMALLMAVGVYLSRKGFLSEQGSRDLGAILLRIIIPCVIINAFQIEYSAAVRDGLILAFAAAFVVHILFIVITKVLGKIFSFNSVERASIIYTNAGNLIIPIVISVLGQEWVVYCTDI